MEQRSTSVGRSSSRVRYIICETGIPGAWTSVWRIDHDNDPATDPVVIPVDTMTNTGGEIDPAVGYSHVYDPKYVPAPGSYTNDTRCVDFGGRVRSSRRRGSTPDRLGAALT